MNYFLLLLQSVSVCLSVCLFANPFSCELCCRYPDKFDYHTTIAARNLFDKTQSDMFRCMVFEMLRSVILADDIIDELCQLHTSTEVTIMRVHCIIQGSV